MKIKLFIFATLLIKLIPKDISFNKVLYQPESGLFGEKISFLSIQCINADNYSKKVLIHMEVIEY